MRRELGMFVALVLLCLGPVASATPTSSAPRTSSTPTRQISMLGIFAIGISFVIITGRHRPVDRLGHRPDRRADREALGQYYPDNPAAGGLGYSLWIGIPVALARRAR